MHDYNDPARPTLVMVYADGEVHLDLWNDDDEVAQPLRDYLTYYLTTSQPDPSLVPSAIYAMCEFCGKLHECKVVRTHQRIESDEWVWHYYEVVAMVPTAAPTSHTPSAISEQKICNLAIRLDGRA